MINEIDRLRLNSLFFSIFIFRCLSMDSLSMDSQRSSSQGRGNLVNGRLRRFRRGRNIRLGSIIRFVDGIISLISKGLVEKLLQAAAGPIPGSFSLISSVSA